MPQTEIVLFREESGRVPVLEWLDDLPTNARKKCYAYIDLLAAEGHAVRRPLADYLRDGIYELRPSYARQQYRILYFFSGGHAIVLSHGVRKDNAVPPFEIERALLRKRQFLKAPKRHSIAMPKELTDEA